MNMIIHDYETINYNPLIIYQKSHALNKNIFILFFCKKSFPLKICSCKIMWIFSDIFSHCSMKTLQLPCKLLCFGCWCLQNYYSNRTYWNTNNGVKGNVYSQRTLIVAMQCVVCTHFDFVICQVPEFVRNCF